MKKLLILLLAALMAISLTACGGDSKDQMGTDPKNLDEATAMHKKLLEEENAILSENSKLWEKLFMLADKGMTMQEDGKNYGDFLLKTLESGKDQFAEDEAKLLQEGAEKIRDIENQLTALEEKFPDVVQKSMDGDMNMPADSMKKFPSFVGKDLDGNDVNSDELFSSRAVTVVNFWFTTCSPCVGELSDLDALNRELAEKDGALIGINAFTLDGNEDSIAEAKDVLAKKGASYQNVYFDSGSEAGKFVEKVYAYPTTYVVDRSGNIVGEPIVGAVNSKSQMETLQSLIDQAIAADKG